MNSVSTQSRLNYFGKFIEIIRSSYKAKTKDKPFEEILGNILMDRREKDLLAEQIYSILFSTKFVSLLTEAEIGSNKGFFSDASTRLSYKFLPPVDDPVELRTQFDNFFDDKKDYHWVQAIPDENWYHFFADIFREISPALAKYIERELLNSILVLAQRAANLGIEPEVVSKIPRIDDLDSPFLGLNREVMLYVEKTLNQYNYNEEGRDSDYKHILVMISQCKTQVSYIYKHKDVFGISLQLTYMMRQLEQYLKRLSQLLELLQTDDKQRQWMIVTDLFKEFVYAENTKYSLRKHFSINLQLLTFKVIENTSKTGEHYISSDRSGYWRLFRKALGGGIIVGLLCCNKTRLYFQHLPIFWEAFFYSLNYSIGFMIIHILGFIIATKQPAMTASTIAANLSNNGQNPNWLETTTQLLIRLVRSQFISLVGNASIAFPVAYGLDWIYFYFNGFHIADPAKAHKLIGELNAWESLAIPHAALAGVYLMISGLIAGYYENKWIYNKFSLRLINHPGLIRILGQKRLNRAANYFEHNFGALAGNFALGVFLGSTSAIGFTFGLPLDIRHITFASGNFGIAFAGLNSHISTDLWINSVIGITCIGIMNVLVSFGLSIAFALKSRNAKFSEVKSLLGNLSWQFFHHGSAFFFPVTVSVKENDELPEAFSSK
ncbi:Site-specific recombinase [Dyadobacter koreensis]|uniref:Site-specific recombinase n=1 Tax=Dyadobacter koreensis TaxID=408657 RepID=A0A1H6RGH8_9BACT|nr:site-specific recombinase [Dyadobacter koreensis]SEI54843.1 Site-specific recombinase [Dyadobacter koreensis]